MNPEHLLFFCTCPDTVTGERIADHLVTERLAACVSLIPGVTSFYRWAGEVQRDAEVQLLIKTHRDRVEPLIARLRELHPYEVPEIIATPIADGLPDYLNWITACTNEQDSAA